MAVVSTDRKRRLRYATAMVALVALGIAACGGSSESGSNAAGADGGQIELTFTHTGIPEQLHPIFDPIIEEYESQHPNVHITMQDLGWTDAGASVGTMAASKSLPDVMYYLPADVFDMASKGLVLDLTDKLTGTKLESDLTADELDAGKYEGKQYLIPSAGSTLLLWSNVNLIKKAGLDPSKPPADWNELLANVKTVSEKTGKPGFSLYAKPTGGELTFLFLSLYASELGGPIWNAETSTYSFLDDANRTAAVTALQHIKDAAGNAQVGISQYNRFDNRTLFAQGDAAYALDEIFMSRNLGDKIKDGSFAATPIPAGASGKSVSALDVGGYFVPKDSAHPEEAWDFLQYLMTTENQLEHEKYGSVPILKSAASHYTGEYWDTIRKTVDTAVPQGGSPTTRAMWQVIDQEMQALMTTEEMPEQALDNIKTGLDGIK